MKVEIRIVHCHRSTAVRSQQAHTHETLSAATAMRCVLINPSDHY